MSSSRKLSSSEINVEPLDENVLVKQLMSGVAAAAVSERKEGEPELLYPELAYASRTAAATHKTTEALAMREFVRLMELKVFLRDKDATKILPSPLMDDMWHAAILNTSFYASLQTKLGLTIHHRPSGATEADAGARAERLVNLTNVYRMRYDEEPIGLNVEPSKEEATIEVPVNNDPISIVALSSIGRSRKTRLIVRPMTTVEELVELIYDTEGTPPLQQRLIFNGMQMKSGYGVCLDHNPFVPLNKPLWSYGIVCDSVVHIVLRLTGC